MIVYVLVFWTVSVLSLISNRYNHSKWPGLLAFCIIVLFQGLRWRTGTDWLPYLNAFLFSNKSNIYNDEIGYFFLNRVIRLLTDNYTIFLLITCGANAYLLKRFADYAKVSNVTCVLLYFFSITVFPVRMSLAVTVFLQAYVYIEKRKLVSYLIVLALSAAIHASAIVALPVYWIVNRRFNTISLLFFYVACAVLGFFTEYVFDNLTQFFSLAFWYQSDFAIGKIDAYMVENENQESPMNLIISLINGGMFILLFSHFRDQFYKDNPQYNQWLNLYVYGLGFNRIFLQTIPYLARVTAYFSGGYVLLILYLLQVIPQKYRTIVLIVFSVYLCIVYLRTINGQYQDLYLPYYSIFDDSYRFVVY